MTKITLLTAASVAAIAFAGTAQAGTITGAINGFAATAAAPYTVAAERTNANDMTTVGGFVLTNTLTSPITVSGGSTQNYSVTFDISGGTIPVANAAALTVNGTANGGSFSVAQGARSTTSINYIVTVTGVGATGYVINGFTLTTQASNSSTETSIAAASTTAILAGGVSTTIDTTGATTLVRYLNALGAFSTSQQTVLAALPNFTGFTTTSGGAGTTSANLANDYALAATNAGTNAQAAFYSGLSAANDGVAAAGTVDAAGILTGAVLTVTAATGGQQLNTLIPALAVAAGAAPVVRTASTATFTLNEAAAETLLSTVAAPGRPDFTLTQPATPVVIQPATFTATINPTFATGFTSSGTSAAIPSGIINLDGVNFIAPWVSGSQAPTQSVIRLSNGAGAASGMVTLKLTAQLARAPGVTTGPGSYQADETCSSLNGASITVPANGELQIGAAELSQCFGDFLRGDIQITIQSASGALTAKMRNVATSGTFESSLGRFSGTGVGNTANPGGANF